MIAKRKTSKKEKKKGAALGQSVRWDLSCFYDGLDDSRIDMDVAYLEQRMQKFYAAHKGNLERTLGAALKDLSEIEMLENRIFGYLFLKKSLDLNNESAKTKLDAARRRIDVASGTYLTFFDLEVARQLKDEQVEYLAKSDPIVKKHLPLINYIRSFRQHMLSEEVETALSKRDKYGSGSWGDFYSEVEANIFFNLEKKKLSLEQALNVLISSKDAHKRAQAQKAINDGLGGYFGNYSAQALNMVVGEKALEDAERHYPHPMSSRNRSNRVPDEIVEALHTAVETRGGEWARSYYLLKAKLLGLRRLRWSDRNAPLPQANTKPIPFSEGMEIVLRAYRSFSPTLAGLIEDIRRQKHIDAPVVHGKESGAYNSSMMLPGNVPATFVLVNYLGAEDDVMTLAHELGHAVHGMLAGEAQGALMMSAPTAYAETASVFGEMTTFMFLKKRLEKMGNNEALLSLLTSKIEGIINTVVRQISFSNFERHVHNAKRRLSFQELNEIWMNVTLQMYGEDGEVFLYRDMDRMWSYIDHFHRPFYVYGYAFGELLTQSLYAQKDRLGSDFEKMYLDVLRAGSTKNVSELLAPFGLDPADPKFWISGIEVGLGQLIQEAYALARRLGYKVSRAQK